VLRHQEIQLRRATLTMLGLPAGHGSKLPLVSLLIEGGVAAYPPRLVLWCTRHGSALALGLLEVCVNVIHDDGDGMVQ
jgi:hypothetical protein